MAIGKAPVTPIKGFAIAPNGVTALGLVTFADQDGNEVTPNQVQCEAYGYTYDIASDTCSVFRYNPNLDKVFTNFSNSVNGAGNVIETGAVNTYILGEENTVRNTSRNNIVIGNKNEVARNINNTNVYGVLGEATATNSIVLGGNAYGDNLGERQSIQLMYGTQTTAGATVDSYLNNTTDSYFAIPDDTIMYFHADVIAVRVAGTNTGSLGDYASWVERGVVINKSGTLSIQRERDAIKSSGTVTDWRPTADVDGTNFVMTVRGETDVTVEWNSNITFTQIKTGVAL